MAAARRRAHRACDRARRAAPTRKASSEAEAGRSISRTFSMILRGSDASCAAVEEGGGGLWGGRLGCGRLEGERRGSRSERRRGAQSKRQAPAVSCEEHDARPMQPQRANPFPSPRRTRRPYRSARGDEVDAGARVRDVVLLGVDAHVRAVVAERHELLRAHLRGGPPRGGPWRGWGMVIDWLVGW